ncbi:MAG TPA: hypothetical protein VNQ97_06585 [Burkholderiaceae bacterium]|nr:hypothetical protein [Burkholderiaceae bacterium]
MPVAGQWPVGSARWPGTVAVLTGVGGSLAIVHAAWPLIVQNPTARAAAALVVVLSCAWAICRILKRRPPAGTLVLHGHGLWELRGATPPVPLRLMHAWPAFGWMTLRFREDAAQAARPIELTIWKTCVSSDAWGQLCLHVARQVAMPERRLNKESS